MENRSWIHPLSSYLGIAWSLWKPEKPHKRTSPGSNPKVAWAGAFSRSEQIPTKRKVPKAGLWGSCKGCHGSWAVRQEQGELWGWGWDAGKGWDRLWQTTAPTSPPRIWVSLLRKQIWERNKKHKMWLLQHKIGDTILKNLNVCQGLQQNRTTFPNTTLCSSVSLEDSAVQKGEPFSSRPWLRQNCLFLNS